MQSEHFDLTLPSPVGLLGLRLRGDALSNIEFIDDAGATAPIKPRHAAAPVVSAIQRYFESSRYRHNLDIELAGTDFQRRVWAALCEIPVGQVTTYGELAHRLGSSARAVGNACRRNPVPILVPCHRVVARHGLGGFAGDTGGRLIEIKRRLLAHEGVEIGGGSPHMA